MACIRVYLIISKSNKDKPTESGKNGTAQYKKCMYGKVWFISSHIKPNQHLCHVRQTDSQAAIITLNMQIHIWLTWTNKTYHYRSVSYQHGPTIQRKGDTHITPKRQVEQKCSLYLPNSSPFQSILYFYTKQTILTIVLSIGKLVGQIPEKLGCLVWCTLRLDGTHQLVGSHSAWQGTCTSTQMRYSSPDMWLARDMVDWLRTFKIRMANQTIIKPE